MKWKNLRYFFSHRISVDFSTLFHYPVGQKGENMIEERARAVAQDLIEFIDGSPTASHAVEQAAGRLQREGFKELLEGDAWNIESTPHFYIRRQHTGLIAVRLGNKPASEAGFSIIGAHTDSPGFRLKPNPLYKKSGYLQAGVEIYGGPILATWADRDLGLAGRVLIKTSEGQWSHRLIRLKKPVVRISLLPIHFQRDVNDKGLVLDKQNHLAPLLGLETESKLTRIEELLATELDIAADSIVDWDIELYDLQNGRFAGIAEEWIVSPKLDNLGMSHAALRALLETKNSNDATRVVVLFDSEEVGNLTLNGAASSFLSHLLKRIVWLKTGKEEDFFRALSRSLCISADQAHALHPNYLDKYEKDHQCQMNKGPVIKINALGKYATTFETSAYFSELCREAGVPFQKFVNRTDMAGGGTIGPVTSALLGIPTVDVGNAIMSMHSIREMGGVLDQELMIRVMRGFFSHSFSSVRGG